MTATAPSSATASTRPLALFVAIALGALLALVVVTLSFSTSNVQSSVDGTRATYSHYLDGEADGR